MFERKVPDLHISYKIAYVGAQTQLNSGSLYTYDPYWNDACGKPFLPAMCSAHHPH
jgi:hypothetical protein